MWGGRLLEEEVVMVSGGEIYTTTAVLVFRTE